MIAVRNYVKVMCFFTLASCGGDLSDDPIPLPTFPDLQLNLSLPSNFALQSTRGYKLIGEGVRGIILYRKNASSVLAFERNCSYQPNEACATTEVHTSGLFMSDPCCGSTFRFEDGNPTGGVAWRPLQQYSTTLSGNTLTITSQVIN
jgi:hypothetical protein